MGSLLIALLIFLTLLFIGFYCRGRELGSLEDVLETRKKHIEELRTELAAAIKERDEARADRDDADEWGRFYHKALLNCLGIKKPGRSA